MLECLVASLVILGSLEVISGLSQLARQNIELCKDSRSLDWEIFCNQLRRELEGAELIKVDQNFLYIKRGSKELRFGKYLTGSDFRKTNWEGLGYQPMLYDLREIQIAELGQLIQINFTMENGDEKVFYYKF